MSTKGPPTTAEVRKAFRHAVDAVGLEPEERLVALEAFNESLGTKPQIRKTRRQEQNQAIRDIQTLYEIMPDILTKAVQVIKRNDFTTGSRHHEKNELAPDPTKPWQEDMTGQSPPTWGDPTGEEACWEESEADRTGKIISAMCVAMGQWLTMAESLQDQTNIDVTVRAKRTMPDCLACGQPILGRVISRYDRSCYDRWIYYRSTHENADKHQFEREMKEKLAVDAITDEKIPT